MLFSAIIAIILYNMKLITSLSFEMSICMNSKPWPIDQQFLFKDNVDWKYVYFIQNSFVGTFAQKYFILYYQL